MKKNEFLHELRRSLKGLNDDDIDEKISFYSEMIDDRIEEGYSEEDAVREIGSVDDVICDVAKDTKLLSLFKQRCRPKRRIRAFEIVLLILGFPLWFPLLLTFMILASVAIFMFYIMDIAFFSVDLSLGVAGLWSLVLTYIYLVKGEGFNTGYVGIGLFGIGTAIILFFACVLFAKFSFRITRRSLIGIKSWFIRGGRNESI